MVRVAGRRPAHEAAIAGQKDRALELRPSLRRAIPAFGIPRRLPNLSL